MVLLDNEREVSQTGASTDGQARGGGPPTLALLATLALACAVVAGLVAYAVTPRPSTVSASTGSGGGAGGGTATAKSGPGAGLPVIARGKLAPGFSLPRLGGGAAVTLSAYRGHPVVLNFFASWCTNCRAELKAFGAVSDASVGKVAFVGIDTNDSQPARASALLKAAGDHYAVGVDPNASVASGKYLVEALPSTVFISASGRIVGQVFGTQTVASLTRWVHRLESLSAGSGRT